MHDPETFTADDPYAPRRSRTGCWVAAILLAVAAGGGLLVVGCVGFFGWGMGLVADQVAADLRDNPVIVERVGEITDISVDWAASMSVPGEDEWVFDVEGTKGEGRLQVVTLTVDAETEDVVSGTLRTPDGVDHDLFPAGAEGDGGSAS